MSERFARYPSLLDQVAFISGGATGLGAEFVAQLAAQCVRVAFVELQDDVAHTLAEEVAGRGHHSPLYQHYDVRDILAMQAGIATAREGSGRTASASTASCLVGS